MTVSKVLFTLSKLFGMSNLSQISLYINNHAITKENEFMPALKPNAAFCFLQTSVLMAVDLLLQHVHPLSASRHTSATEAITNSIQNEAKVG